jgi:hypothetical protein
MKHDLWDTQASYTMFKSKASESSGGAIYPAFLASRLSLLEPFSSGEASLRVHYNMFNWDLGRAFLNSRRLVLRPFIGFKGGWITQKIRSSWIIPDLLITSAEENIDHKFMGAGPKGGATAKFCFGNIRNHSLSFIGSFDSAYLWGHWSIKDRYVDNIGTIIFVKTDPRDFGSLVLHAFLGLEWDCNFDRDRSHFGLKIGYEIEDWLNQLQIFSDTSGSQNNALFLQGLNAGLKFDF